MAATEQVILVDENDNPTGTAEKLRAHREGLCHRAFSVFIFCEGLLLLQQRAREKYHSPELWTNTCCSHPRPGEEITSAAERRLQEEMGIQTILTHVGRFHYIAHFNNGLIENEVDHVFIGTIKQKIVTPNSAEAAAYRWISLAELQKELTHGPQKFTPWLKRALEIVEKSVS